MKNEINISESEWTVMEYLWNNPMVTITEIRKALSPTGWSDSTIKTLVRRLVFPLLSADFSTGMSA